MIIAKWIHLFPSRTQKLSTSYAEDSECENKSLPIYFFYVNFYFGLTSLFFYYILMIMITIKEVYFEKYEAERASSRYSK